MRVFYAIMIVLSLINLGAAAWDRDFPAATGWFTSILWLIILIQKTDYKKQD